MSRQYSVDDIAKYKAGSGYSDWISNLNDIKGNGNTFTRVHPDQEPRIIRRFGDEIIQEIRIIKNYRNTKFMLTLTINDGTIFGDRHIIIQKRDDQPLEFAIDTGRPRINVEFRVYPDDDTLTVRKFLTEGYQNHSIGTMREYIQERFIANNMMTADIARFTNDAGTVDGQPHINEVWEVDLPGDGLISWWDNYNHRLNEFSNAIGMGRSQEGGRKYYIDSVPPQEDSGLEHDLSKSYFFLRRNKQMMKSKKANAMHQEMFGTGMSSDEMDLEGEGISEWMSNLSKLFKLLKIRATM